MDGTLEDRLAIERQLYELCYLIDEPDPAGWVAIYTEDGVSEAVMIGASEPFSRSEGTDELRAFIDIVTAGDRPPSLHHLTGIVFDELTADTARTRSMLVVTTQSAETSEPVINTHGIRHDRWRKTPDGWRLAHRRYIAYGYRSQPPAEVLTNN